MESSPESSVDVFFIICKIHICKVFYHLISISSKFVAKDVFLVVQSLWLHKPLCVCIFFRCVCAYVCVCVLDKKIRTQIFQKENFKFGEVRLQTPRLSSCRHTLAIDRSDKNKDFY